MVTVIIINWNSGELLQQCLRDLSRQELTPTRILVIDNGSTDASIEAASRMSSVEVQRLGTNHGFAGGNNRALEQINTEYVALLNPDAFPEPDWLKELVAAAHAFPEVAAFGSRQMVYEGDGLVDGLGDVYHLSGLIWRRGYGRKFDSFDENPIEIFSPCAGAALYRTDTVKDIGGFSEDFFCYAEDVDLGFRLRLAGNKAVYVPDAVVHHVGSATTGGQHSDFSVYYGHRNLVWTFIKNMPGVLFYLLLPLHIMLNLFTIIWFSAKGQGRVILRAKWDALKGVPKMWRKRKYIQKNRVASIGEIWKQLDKRMIFNKSFTK